MSSWATVPRTILSFWSLLKAQAFNTQQKGKLKTTMR